MLTLNPCINNIWIYDRIKIKNESSLKRIKSEYDSLNKLSIDIIKLNIRGMVDALYE